MTAFFLEKCPATIAAKTLCCDFAACMFHRLTTFQSRARHVWERIHFGNESTFEKIVDGDAKIIAVLF
jgi:hypothetical protein